MLFRILDKNSMLKSSLSLASESFRNLIVDGTLFLSPLIYFLNFPKEMLFGCSSSSSFFSSDKTIDESSIRSLDADILF